ncbi:Gp49 family protein [Serratia sp. IR-2025]
MITVTKASIEAKIRNVYYINAGVAVQASDQGYNERDLEELKLVTICIIILENGFKVEGTSACVDPSRYNEVIGQEEAYKAAFDKIWEKEGYLLKQQLHEANQK